ncbi:hypothetical protein UCDDS831_g05643 [Diplodia seriata]|uniref:Uncharacterized protein n=1 Tax=Diplodia seriata TaxID=420778 RepID=A0A0G2E9K1_9PEZI|nr:hypothetical protein UCDDS831_g05643 [Diplodia seriata]
MGKVFFVDWALWQKMTFVLTIFIGWMKVLHTNRKMKKLTKPVGARADQEPQMVEAAAAPRRKSGDDIPFGIRAIQSGIEVDGIWISGTNTPVPGSPTQSAQDKPEASSSNSRPISTLDIPGPAMAGPQASMLRHSATLDTLEGDAAEAQAMHERSASGGANPYGYNFSSNGSSRKSSGSSDNNPAHPSSDDDTTGSTTTEEEETF